MPAAEGLGQIAARLQRQRDARRGEETVGPAEEFGPHVVDPQQLDEDRRGAEELDQPDRDRAQRPHIHPHETEHEAADDRARKRDEADLDRDGKSREQRVALVPDEAFPVAHARFRRRSWCASARPARAARCWRAG